MTTRNEAWDRLVTCAGFSIPVVLLATVPALQYPYWQWTALVLATPVVTWGALPMHRAALAALRQGGATPDTLVSLGTTLAYGWSLWAMFFGGAGGVTHIHPFTPFSARSDGAVQIYFEVTAGVVTLALLGRHLTARARRRAGAALAELHDLLPETAVVQRDGAAVEIAADDVEVGEVVVVAPDARAPVDGTVAVGPFTGERVLAGQALGDDPVEVEAVAVGPNRLLATALAEAEAARPDASAAHRLADRAGRAYVPVVLGFAAATAGFWVGTGVGGATAVATAVAVLLVASPAALADAVGPAVLTGIGRAAQLGVLFTRVSALEAAGRVDMVVLGRAGVLTGGLGQVHDVAVDDGVEPDDVVTVAAALEAHASHPIATAITTHAAQRSGFWPSVSDVTVLDGLGVRGTTGAREVVLGRESLVGGPLPDELATAVATAEEAGATVAVLAWDGGARAVFAVAEPLVPTSVAAVTALRGLGLTPALLTGASAGAALSVAHAAGIDLVLPNALPDRKVDVIRRLQDDGHAVAVVGDATRNRDALAAADLGIALRGWSEPPADVTLLRPDPADAAVAVRIARRTYGVVEGNLAWALAYPLVTVPLAAAGMVHPLLAGAAGVAAGLLVVANSLRLHTST